MRPIGLDDILGRERYGHVRDEVRRRIIEHKRARRVAVGDSLSLLFEDRATVWYQTQEMLWVENITDLDAIRAELEVYNQLMPGARDLAATLMIELRDQATMREEFQRLLGLDRHVTLVVGMHRIAAAFEEGRQTDDKISAVQYVRFPIDDAARRDLGTAPMEVVVDHPNHVAAAVLPDATRASIVGSLLDATVADRDLDRVRGVAR